MNAETVKAIEESDIFFVIVTPSYLADPQCLEQIQYGKALKKPFALAIEEGLNVDDRFSGCDIVAVTTFNRDRFEQERNRLDEWVRNLREYLVERRK